LPCLPEILLLHNLPWLHSHRSIYNIIKISCNLRYISYILHFTAYFHIAYEYYIHQRFTILYIAPFIYIHRTFIYISTILPIYLLLFHTAYLILPGYRLSNMYIYTGYSDITHVEDSLYIIISQVAYCLSVYLYNLSYGLLLLSLRLPSRTVINLPISITATFPVIILPIFTHIFNIYYIAQLIHTLRTFCISLFIYFIPLIVRSHTSYEVSLSISLPLSTLAISAISIYQRFWTYIISLYLNLKTYHTLGIAISCILPKVIIIMSKYIIKSTFLRLLLLFTHGYHILYACTVHLYTLGYLSILYHMYHTLGWLASHISLPAYLTRILYITSLYQLSLTRYITMYTLLY
jgi:hypothetical protein